ncbi:MAG: thymidine phosphorylase [Clostridia bacterium]|nr:thymidine phosphorylase [Clostridia bacterium]
MNILEIIAKKRDKKSLTKEEIEYFIEGYTNGSITDYQASALVMAIYINGMNDEEITNLTLAMAHSGEMLDLSVFGKNVVDKHSTGGVGDKVTLILMPIIASFGIPVAKMSGRGLGFTGGTIDKLESIPGYNTSVNIEDFINNVKEKGISLIGQTMNLAPADKKIYALRDTIACTDSIPLIASSIMSKKIAAGANKIVLDVTCGFGAFMQNKEDAIKLSETMNRIGKLADKETICIITNMDEPLGSAVGNNLEVIEAINALNGKMADDLKEVILELGAYMIKLAGINEDIDKNKEMILENIQNKKAYNKFVELVENQGGDISYIEDTTKFAKAKYIVPVVCKKDGYVEELNARKVGEISGALGAGRVRKEDDIDETVGVMLCKKVSDEVRTGDILAYVHANNEELSAKAVKDLEEVYKIGDIKPKRLEVILGIVK